MSDDKVRTYAFAADSNVVRGRVPGSKSVAARAMILRRVFGNLTELEGIPDCGDSMDLKFNLEKYDCAMATPAKRDSSDIARYWLGDGGTTYRFFTALAASTPGFSGEIGCSSQLARRPMKPLYDALEEAGANLKFFDESDYSIIGVKGRSLDGTGVKVDSSKSSQFLSALMMVSPLWRNPLEYDREVSARLPYVVMTEKMVDIFSEKPAKYRVEGDWSAASYFYQLALIRPDIIVEVEGLLPPEQSLQGDSACVEIFGTLGVSTEFIGEIARLKCVSHPDKGSEVEFNLEKTPDLVPAVVAGCCFAGIRFHISGVANLRYKESDRLSALREELSKLGYSLIVGNDSIEWHGEMGAMESRVVKNLFKESPLTVIDSHGDHRIVMSTMLHAAMGENIRIKGSLDVYKSFPDFFHEFKFKEV